MKLVRGETQLLHKTFIASLIGKFTFGIIEIIAAVISLLVTHTQIMRFAHWLNASVLHQSSSSVIGHFVLHSAASIDSGTTEYLAIYLGIHGIIKVALVLALFRQKLWAYPAMLIALAIFVATQCVQMITDFTFGLLLLTIFDVFVFYLTNREWKLHRASVTASK